MDRALTVGARSGSRCLVALLLAMLPGRPAFCQPATAELFDPALAAGTLPALPLLRSLHGRWAGDGIEILLDAQRMQGNTNPGKPFARDPLVIRDVTPPWIVFAVGPGTFVARIEGDAMTLTQPGWPAPRIVLRTPPQP